MFFISGELYYGNPNEQICVKKKGGVVRLIKNGCAKNILCVRRWEVHYFVIARMIYYLDPTKK